MRTVLQIAMLSVLVPWGAVYSAAAWGDWQTWGDQGDGSYRNPVLPADYSDIDCIRVGADYYAISSTFQYSPGVVILQSKDLVNWTITTIRRTRAVWISTGFTTNTAANPNNETNPNETVAAGCHCQFHPSGQNVERPALLLDVEEPVALFGATLGYQKNGRIAFNVHIPLNPKPQP